MNCKRTKHELFRPAFAIGLMVGAMTLQSCSDDLLTGQPSWLGNSIYDELSESGNYKTTLQLIDDLGLHDQLSHTGSVTVFVADDATYEKWFQKNSWGVKSYSQLSLAQKKALLNSQMINNAYLIELMSSVSANPPEAGMAMRRTTASSVFDSIYVMKPELMNGNLTAWKWYKENNKSMILFRDGTMMSGTTQSTLSAPMMHFLPAFMQKYKFTDEDIRILTNGRATSTGDAVVGNQKVVERDITCKNGYIQKMDGVIEPYANMAQVLREHKSTALWSRLIDRFSAPYYDKQKTLEYNRMYKQNVDSVFTLRYFTSDNEKYPVTSGNPSPEKVPATLNFDPGWNQYMYANTSGYDLHYDAGAMLVPTDEALNKWWNADGKPLKDKYKTWDNLPDLVLSKLLNVNLLGTFTEAIPSRFDNIVNDAKLPMGVKMSDVDSTFLACNGVVYLTNRVFSPMEYSSVSFPALVNQDAMSVIYWAIDKLDFLPYLNSMDSYYSLILPTNEAMRYYIDPATYGETQPTILEFYYDDKERKVAAHRYAYTIENGKVVLGDVVQLKVSDAVVKNRLRDIVNQMIIVGNVENGYSYYKSKNGTLVQVANAGQQNSMVVSGGLQEELNLTAKVDSIYDMSAAGNGKSYRMNHLMPMSASHSVYETLTNHPEYSEFLELLSGSEKLPADDQLLVSSMKFGDYSYSCAGPSSNSNIRLFGSYNYTVYVPTNESIKKAISDGILPTWADYDKEIELSDEGTQTEREAHKAAAEVIKNRILNFVRYHIQDNSIAVNGAPETDSNNSPILNSHYESMMLNPQTDRYYWIDVNIANQDLTLKDYLGDSRKVIKQKGLYNNICREYWMSGNSFLSKEIYTTADAIVHQIDGPLYYEASQKTPWKSQVNKAKRRIYGRTR